MSFNPKDPMEGTIAGALMLAGIGFEVEGPNTKGLDFYLIDFDVYLECKRFHSNRTDEQLQRDENVIYIQGMKAAEAFASMLLTRKKIK